MDGNHFDKVTRSLASGASRRSILKGLLGLGGAAAAGATMLPNADARAAGTGPRIPPPPPPTTTSTTPAPTTTTAFPCQGFTCGLDCCDTQLQCCDGECCPVGTSCLIQLFPEDATIQEETCCRSDLACGADPLKCCADGQECCADEGCCNGRCYFDVFLEQELCCTDEQLCDVSAECCDSGWLCCADEGCCLGPCYVNTGGEELCCPAGFAEVCGNECCASGTHQCCITEAGGQTCVPLENGCCKDSDCPSDPDNCIQGTCNLDTRTCAPAGGCGEGTVCFEGSCCTPISPEEACAEIGCGSTADRGCGLTTFCSCTDFTTCSTRFPSGERVCTSGAVCFQARPCGSDADCTPRRCDTNLGLCVICLSDADCPATGPICIDQPSNTQLCGTGRFCTSPA